MNILHNIRLAGLVLAAVCLLPGSFSCCSKTKDGKGDQDGVRTVTYQPSTAVFPNPERGFMHTHSTLSDNNSLSTVTLAALRERNVSLILRIIYLQDFKDRPMDEAKLTAIRSDMAKIRDAGLKTILRFAYTDDMSGTDAPLSVVEQHLDQLKPVFEENKDIIAFVQAGFIGAWGEWHASSNNLTTPENQQRVLNKLLEAVPPAIMVQLRTPVMKQRIFNTSVPVSQAQATSGAAIARVGHHNDCFLSNTTDYGTYTDGNIQAEKNYISQEALFVPTGGETCPPTGGFSPDCPEGRNQMKLLKWTYLNLDWYQPTINLWRASGCFDEFQRALGYRLVLESSTAAETAGIGRTLPIEFKLINRGYAPMYHRKAVSLVLLNKATGTQHQVALSADLRICRPDQMAAFNEQVSLAGIPAGAYELYLAMRDQHEGLRARPEYAVRLANEQVWQAETGLNSLLRQLVIE